MLGRALARRCDSAPRFILIQYSGFGVQNVGSTNAHEQSTVRGPDGFVGFNDITCPKRVISCAKKGRLKHRSNFRAEGRPASCRHSQATPLCMWVL
jgi:hypothetical protein